MKRLALIVAALAACVMFTACPDKPIEEFEEFEEFGEEFKEPDETETNDEKTNEGYYIEEIKWITYIGNYVQTILYTQYFNKVGNDVIYDPCLDSNLRAEWVDFGWYCKHDSTPILHISGDSIIYDLKHYGPFDPNEYPLAKVHFENGFFVFSYNLTDNAECVHTCVKLSNLPN